VGNPGGGSVLTRAQETSKEGWRGEKGEDRQRKKKKIWVAEIGTAKKTSPYAPSRIYNLADKSSRKQGLGRIGARARREGRAS